MPFTQLHAGIGLGLALRGCQPHFIVCDSICQGACIPSTDPPHQPIGKDRCRHCTASRWGLLSPFGFDQSTVSAYLDERDLQGITALANQVSTLAAQNKIADLSDLDFAGVGNVGQDILATLIRYYRTDKLSLVTPDIAARYARMAAITTITFQKALDRLAPTYLFIPHNQYAPAGPAVRIARQRGLPYFTYATHHRGGIAFKTIHPEDTCQSPFAMSDAAWQNLRVGLGNKTFLSQEVKSFFTRRYTDHSEDMRFIQGKVGEGTVKNNPLSANLPQKRRVFAMFTHINWDNSFGFGESPFKTFAEWIEYTTRVIVHVDSVDWVIKIHPAEYFSETERDLKNGAYAQVQEFIPNLPEHISILPPHATINPVDFLQSVDGVISCCGTSGLEAAALGKIVINASSGYYSQRGFTYDPMSEPGDPLENYKNLLIRAAELPNLTEQQIQDAQKFLLHFFSARSSRQLSYDHNYGLQIQHPWQWTNFLPGKNTEIDLVCQGFLNRSDIFFPQEQG